MYKHFGTKTSIGGCIMAVCGLGVGVQSQMRAAEPSTLSAVLPSSTQTAVSTAGVVAVDRDFGRLPVSFIPNEGQADQRVSFYVQGRDKVVYFTSEGLTLSLLQMDDTGEGRPVAERRGRWNVKLDFVAVGKGTRPVGLEKSGTVVSYFRGPRDQWHAGLSAYAKIAYQNLWPGIDLVYSGTVDTMKHEFVVRPGADPSQIRLAYRGATSVTRNQRGQIEVSTPVGGFVDDAPVAWQDIGGTRRSVAVEYAVDGTEYGFHIGAYDPAYPLVLDPVVLVYCGFIGGSGTEIGSGIAVDSAGNAYVAGRTISSDGSFPAVVGPDLSLGGVMDAFVAKVSADGASLAYCGFIGGSGYDGADGIAVDSAGNAYVTGLAHSTEATFPVIVGPDLTSNGDGDAFVAKVSPDGASLQYCGFIGGSQGEEGAAIAIDAGGNAYVTGYTMSYQDTFPVMVGPGLTFGGVTDAFVAKVNAYGTALAYCGYIGGSLGDEGYGIAVDPAGNAYVTGFTTSTEASFPVIVGPDLTSNGLQDSFIAKVSSNGTSMQYCGFIGGSDAEMGYGIAVDPAGSAYVAGFTGSTEASFPVIIGPDLTSNGDVDAFLAAVSPSGASLQYCGFIGGASADEAYGIAVDSVGNVYVTGIAASTEASFPVVDGPDLTSNGGYDAFAAKLSSSGASLAYCGFIGGSGNEAGYAIAIDPAGNAYITGATRSSGDTFPVAGGPDLTSNGDLDAFVTKITPTGGTLRIDRISSRTGRPGSKAQIFGAGFARSASANIVVFGSRKARVMRATSTKLTVTIPSRLRSGQTVDVVVKVNSNLSNPLAFQVR